MISFYIVSDAHYFSKKNWVDGKPITERVRGDQIALTDTPEILDAYIDAVIDDKETDTVLFLGDNVDSGDMTSHGEFKKRLEKLESAGKKVYLTYATHDYCGAGDDESDFNFARRFNEADTEPVPFMRKSGLFDYYYHYAAENAQSVHKESGSYTVKLSDKILLIAIIDNGNGKSHCGLFDDGHKWLKEQLEEAKNRGEYVLIAVHHPVLPPWEFYRNVTERDIYGGYDELIDIICEYGVKAVFTGHTHVQNIRKYTHKNGNSFYDISTIALANAAGKMRKVTIDEESGECKVESVTADLKDYIDGYSFNKLYQKNFPGIWEKLIPFGDKNYSEFLNLAEGYLPTELLKKYKIIIHPVLKKVNNMKLSAFSLIAGANKKLSKAEKNRLKETYFKTVIFEILRHIYAGNAPYYPDTAEYKIATSFCVKLDKTAKLLNNKNINKFLKNTSFEELVKDFLYNNRTGDDDSITFSLK